MSDILVPSRVVTANGDSGILTGSNHLETVKTAIFVLSVTAAATGVGDTFDLYLQSSYDGGTTWDDFVHFTQVLGNGGAKVFKAIWQRDVAPTVALGPQKDGTLAAGVGQGPVGGTWRAKWVIVDSGAHNQSFTFSLNMYAARSRA